MTSLEALQSAERLVRRHVPETPLHHWPLLSRRSGAEVWVKHENHTRIGAFKIRGGLVYMERLKTLIEYGHDFQEALVHARDLAGRHGLHMLASFHDDLVRGVASYGLEIFRSHDDIDTVYVPIGLGSGLCGTLRARDALASRADVVGVVAENAPCYARSFATGAPVTTNRCDTIADGMAVRVPHDDAVEEINAGAERIVSTSEDDIRAAMRHYFTDTHNVAEGAGAAPLAALLAECDHMTGRKVVLVLSGGNVDRDLFARILQEA